jgi:hypothetical protein
MAILTIVFLRESKYVTGDRFALSAFAFQSGLSWRKIVASYERFRINRIVVGQFLESTFGKEKFLCLRVEAIPAKTCTFAIMIGLSRAFLVVEVNPRWAGGRVGIVDDSELRICVDRVGPPKLMLLPMYP